MSRPCVRGCTVEGVHYATCADFGRPDGECKGCAPVEARDGVLLCDRCYGRLRRRLEVVPDLVAHLRVICDPLKAARYDRIPVQTSGPDGSPAPVPVDVLDALRDIMHAIQARQLEPGAESDVAYYAALDAVGYLLENYDELANDRDGILQWWQLVMSRDLEDAPGFWTITGALSRWPLEDRRRFAEQPCPECGLRSVAISPPRHRYSLIWLACTSCGWRKNETDDDGLWAAAFGLYAEHDPEREEDSMSTIKKANIETKDVDLSDALAAGIEAVAENEGANAFAAFLVGATPALAEEFAKVADSIAADVRKYQNGDLIAGGARMVAKAIRAAVETTAVLNDLPVAEPAPEPEVAAA